MTTNDPKIGYLKEHIPYEYLMFNYTFTKLKSCYDHCEWNAFFVSCVVYGRNLYNFLRNENDNRNYSAGDFTIKHKYKTLSHLGMMPSLINEVLHIGKSRKTDTDRKVV